MSDLFGNHIVGFPTRRLISLGDKLIVDAKKTRFSYYRNNEIYFIRHMLILLVGS